MKISDLKRIIRQSIREELQVLKEDLLKELRTPAKAKSSIVEKAYKLRATKPDDYADLPGSSPSVKANYVSGKGVLDWYQHETVKEQDEKFTADSAQIESFIRERFTRR